MSRLRPVNIHDDFGHISRVDGDTRLTNRDLQENFFLQLCQKHSLRPLLHELTVLVTEDSPIDNGNANSAEGISSLRKLREGIIASARQDEWAISVFEMIVRYTVIQGHMESYFPAMRYLLNVLYVEASQPELYTMQMHFINELLALHLCYNNEYLEALELRNQLGSSRSRLVDTLIIALIRDDWSSWYRSCKNLNLLQAKMVEKLTPRVAQRALTSISSAYLSADMAWLTTVCGTTVRTMLKACDCVVEGDKVIFRSKKKAKTNGPQK